MSGPLADAILELAERAGATGIAMGQIVDTLVGEGLSPATIEREIWNLLARRRLTPAGFICRTIRRHIDGQQTAKSRVYEFMLVPWSAALDQQLELGLEHP